MAKIGEVLEETVVKGIKEAVENTTGNTAKKASKKALAKESTEAANAVKAEKAVKNIPLEAPKTELTPEQKALYGHWQSPKVDSTAGMHYKPENAAHLKPSEEAATELAEEIKKQREDIDDIDNLVNNAGADGLQLRAPEASATAEKPPALHKSEEGAYYERIQRSIEERKKARQIKKDEKEAAEQNAAEQDWNNRPMSQKIVDFVTGTDAPATTTEFEARAKKAINKKVFNDGRMDRLASKGAKDFNGSEGLRETRVNTLKNDYVNKTAEIRAAAKNIETWRDAFGDKNVDEVMSDLNEKFKKDISQKNADFGDYFRHYHGKTVLGGIGVGASVLSLANSKGHMDNAQLYSDPFGG